MQQLLQHSAQQYYAAITTAFCTAILCSIAAAIALTALLHTMPNDA